MAVGRVLHCIPVLFLGSLIYPQVGGASDELDGIRAYDPPDISSNDLVGDENGGNYGPGGWGYQQDPREHSPNDRPIHARPHNMHRPFYTGYDWYNKYPVKDEFKPNEDFILGLQQADALAEQLLPPKNNHGKQRSISDAGPALVQQSLDRLETMARLFIVEKWRATKDEPQWDDNQQRSMDLAELWAQSILGSVPKLQPMHAAPRPKSTDDEHSGLEHLNQMLGLILKHQLTEHEPHDSLPQEAPELEAPQYLRPEDRTRGRTRRKTRGRTRRKIRGRSKGRGRSKDRGKRYK